MGPGCLSIVRFSLPGTQCCNDRNPEQIFFGDHTFYVVQSSRSISVLPVRVDFLFVRLWFNININTFALIIHSLWWTFKICLKQYGHTCWSRTVLRIASFVVNSKPKKPPSFQVGDMYRLQRKKTHTHIDNFWEISSSSIRSFNQTLVGGVLDARNTNHSLGDSRKFCFPPVAAGRW